VRFQIYVGVSCDALCLWPNR